MIILRSIMCRFEYISSALVKLDDCLILLDRLFYNFPEIKIETTDTLTVKWMSSFQLLVNQPDLPQRSRDGVDCRLGVTVDSI